MAEEEVNLTPMLDIVFIMLIFFIVTATFVKEIGISTSRPSDAPENEPPPEARKNIQMEVTPDCWVILERRRIDPGQVGPNVQRLLAERPGANAVVSIQGDADTQCVVEVMDQIREGGVAGDISLRKAPEAPQ